jgi:hypothetical protein
LLNNPLPNKTTTKQHKTNTGRAILEVIILLTAYQIFTRVLTKPIHKCEECTVKAI